MDLSFDVTSSVYYPAPYKTVPNILLIQCERLVNDFLSVISKQNIAPIASLRNIPPSDSNRLFPAVSLKETFILSF